MLQEDPLACRIGGEAVTSPLYVYHYRTGCRKIPHLTEAAAKEVSAEMRRDGRKGTRGLEAYMCR